MIRLLYQLLLWLHPPPFRREFAGEMLWIYEASVQTEGAPGLLADGFRSLARQWLFRSGSWKIGVALAGAFLQVSLGGLGMFLIPRSQAGPFAIAPYAGDWIGTVKADKSSAPMELVLGRHGDAWQGQVTLLDRTTSILDFRPAKDAASFRISTPEGDLRFRAYLTHGRIAGVMESADAAPVAWEVARAPGRRHIDANLTGIVQITMVLVPGLILSVVLLALWTRSFTHKRTAVLIRK